MTEHFDVRDALFVLGMAGVCIGLGAYDWRWAAIFGGAVLLVLAVAPALRKGE